MANSDFITNEKDFEIPEGWAEVGPRQKPEPAGAPGPSIPIDRFASGAVSSMTLGLNTDIAASKMGGDVPSFRIQPPQPSSIAAGNSATQSVIKQTQVVEGPGVLFETNGIKDPAQDVQNTVAGTGISVTVDNVGNKTISATGSQTQVPQWPLPNTAIVFMARAIVGQTGLQTIGDASTAATSGGTVSISNGSFPTSTQGVVVPFSVGSGGGAAFVGWAPINSSSNINGIFRAGRNNKYQARVGVGGSTVGVVVFLGFSTADASDMRTFPFTSTTHYLGVYTPGLSSSDNWHATIGGTSVDTGVPIGTGATEVEIIMNDTANTTSFSVNGSAPTVISGSNPSSFNWFPTATFAQNNASSFNFIIEYFYAQQDF
jgi:hypothetical protein